MDVMLRCWRFLILYINVDSEEIKLSVLAHFA